MQPIRAPKNDERFIVSPFGKPWEHWLLLGFGVAAIAIVVVLAIVVEPDARGFGTHEKLGLPACIPMERWGVPCPGCGVTTSVALAWHGQVWASIRNQPFGFVTAIALPSYSLWAISTALRGRNLASEVSRWRMGRLGVALVAVMALSWLFKLALVREWIG
ncbi:MAG: DUF2752 domain-containing protein [Planctomycetota bacterium]|nr:DUF2752 domain-containing protein [Planctomycetota bacterium]